MLLYRIKKALPVAISDRNPLAPDPKLLVLDKVYMMRVYDIGFVNADK
jgi:hypothetical protein